jgi:hypothetical protein
MNTAASIPSLFAFALLAGCLLSCTGKPESAGSARIKAPPAVPGPQSQAPRIDADRLTVRTDPPGCRVILDGRVVGESPLAILSLPTRSMKLRIEKDGYVPAEKTIWAGGSQHLVVDIALAPASGERAYGTGSANGSYPAGRSRLSVASCRSSSWYSEVKPVPMEYRPELAFDGEGETCWVENDSSDGIGEWIEGDFANKVMVREIAVINGYSKKDYYEKNNRARSLKVVFQPSGQNVVLNLRDGESGLQRCALETPIECASVRLIIDDVYHGWKYKDTCIAEIQFFGSEADR